VYIRIHTQQLSQVDIKRIFISVFFGLVLLIGTGLSTIHFHIDDTSRTETVHQLVEDDFQCVICGSAFKYSPQPKIVSEIYTTPTLIRYSQPALSYESSPSPSFDGRAPPAVA
jgi:hypothetical protein